MYPFSCSNHQVLFFQLNQCWDAEIYNPMCFNHFFDMNCLVQRLFIIFVCVFTFLPASFFILTDKTTFCNHLQLMSNLVHHLFYRLHQQIASSSLIISATGCLTYKGFMFIIWSGNCAVLYFYIRTSLHIYIAIAIYNNMFILH